MTTMNELPSHPLTHLDGVVHDRPVVDAHEVFSVLDESPTDSGPHDSVAIRDASDAEASLNALLVAWEAVMAHIADRSAIAQDHPLIHALMDALIAHGLLPASGDISRDDVIQFHDWLVGMPTDALVEDKALIEVWVLANWGAANHGGGLDQVTLTGAINTFQQYTVHAHVTVDGQVLTLSCLDPEPVTVDHALHATGQQLFRQVWGDPSPQDYRQAHEALTLSDDDQAQLLQWFQSTFPDGLDGLSALAMIEAILQAMVAEDPQYVPDIGDTWATVSEFLASKSGDCEDFSHFLYAALRHAFSALPIEDQPELSVVAGLVGQGAYVLGHSVLEVTIGEEVMVIDLTRAVVGDANPVLRAVDYRRQVQFQEVLRYDATETTVRATDVDLASFSTASVGGDADTFVDYVDGVIRESSATSPSYLYQTLMTDVIAEETRTLTQQQGIFSSPDDALVGVSDLESFSVVNFFSNQDYVDYFLEKYDLDLSDICQMNDQLMMAKGRGRVSRSVFSFLGSNMDLVLSDLVRFRYIDLDQDPEFFVLMSSGVVERTNGDLFAQLTAMGILTPYGEIDGDQLTNASTLHALRDLFRLSIGAYEYVSEQADHLIAYLRNKHYVFSSTGGAYNGDSVFGQTLSQFEALTERLFKGFSGSVVGVERDALSDIGQSEFVTSEPGSLFLRTQHQAIQEAMSLFFSLQNKISAFMTVIFSLADMTSSISTKLGEEHSTASSTSRQRQKLYKRLMPTPVESIRP